MIPLLDRCQIYVDGLKDGTAVVPKHMLTSGGMVQDIIESKHPYANNTDRLGLEAVRLGLSLV